LVDGQFASESLTTGLLQMAGPWLQPRLTHLVPMKATKFRELQSYWVLLMPVWMYQSPNWRSPACKSLFHTSEPEFAASCACHTSASSYCLLNSHSSESSKAVSVKAFLHPWGRSWCIFHCAAMLWTQTFI
jgi:hypothetical protein